ncbi:hypothetical protein [Maribacter sp. 2304DJ31-5]|uniref:hypothetical protein n=1 Tax=Maribacter sp. 2304DJ31-5 TaxID=3386273 RepID=UPI0039BC8320
MTWVRRIFDFYLDASIHIAFAVFALVQVTILTLDISNDGHLSWFLFFGTISCYNFIKFGVEAEKYLVLVNRYHKNIQLVSFLALALALYHATFLNKEVWLGIGALLFLTGLYALPVLPSAKNLRSWGSLKIFIVALVWAGATVILPYLVGNVIVSWDVGIEFVQRFLIVLILLIPFEIRDLKYDKEELGTLPQRYGITKTKILGACLIILFFFLTFVKDGITHLELWAKAIVCLLLLSVIYVTKQDQSKYFASFWVEGIPIVWYCLAFILGKGF